jgi:predicted nuclease of restriction endonuclease-like (RecB) superfamily
MVRKKQSDTPISLALPSDYADFLNSLKTRVRQAQTKAMLSVNRELIQLCWDIGREIAQRQEQAGWGQSVLERLADDLQKALPGVSGFSRSNVFRMRAFYLAYRTPEFFAQPVRQIAEDAPPESVAHLPWGHNVVLFQKVKDTDQRPW